MAASDYHYTDELSALPDNISVNALPNSAELSKRSLDRGLNYFFEGYVHDIKMYIKNDNQEVINIKAKCWRSMCKNQEAHKLFLDLCGPKVTEAHCSCKAGMSGHCSHIVGLLKSLQGFKLYNYSKVPTNLSSTSVPQQWHKPRGEKIMPVPINHVIVATPVENRKRKPIICSFDTKYKLPKITEDSLNHLKQLERTPLSVKVRNDIPKTTTIFGQVQMGSFLSYQTANMIERKELSDDVPSCDFSLHGTPPIKLQEEFKDLNHGLFVENPRAIELLTREQSNCQAWFNFRTKRLTASNFGKIIKRRILPTDKFIDQLIHPISFTACSLQYGIRNEPKAKAKYLDRFKNRHLHECGFVINNEFSFIGATPDGVVCDNDSFGIIEIKCPYSARNLTIQEACQKNDFYLQCDENHITLKQNHNYFAQIQGQLLITACKFCDFIVFTQKDLHVERIFPNVEYMETMLQKLCLFYKNYVKPLLLKQARCMALQDHDYFCQNTEE